jgi:hypothetical protein
MKMKRTMVSTTVAMVLGLGLASSAAAAETAPAPAATDTPSATATPQVVTSNCDPGWFCVWPQTGYGGDRYQWSESNANWSQWAINDDEDSAKNKDTAYRQAVYKDSNYNGGCRWWIGIGVNSGGFGSNDQGSSHKRYSPSRQAEACSTGTQAS